MDTLLLPIRQFLHCETPAAWIHAARQPENLPVLLIDHLICELKAAQSAMLLIRRYAVDAESGDALLAWLKPYEDFVYRKHGNWRDLADHAKLTKTMLPQRHTPYSQRSEEHTSELQSRENLVCRLLLEKKKDGILTTIMATIQRINVIGRREGSRTRRRLEENKIGKHTASGINSAVTTKENIRLSAANR